jgi:hypothetical protein
MAPEIVLRQFEACARMGEQPAFGDRANAAVSVPEGLQYPGVAGAGFKPEAGFERRYRDDAFDGGVPCYEAE